MVKLFKSHVTYSAMIITTALLTETKQDDINIVSKNVEIKNSSDAARFLSTINTNERKELANSKSQIRSTGKSYVNERPSGTENLIFCDERPKFRLGRGVLLTYLLRLKLCQLVTGQPWFDDECTKQVYALTNYHRLSYSKICNPAKYAAICQLTETRQDQLQPSAIIQAWLMQKRY